MILLKSNSKRLRDKAIEYIKDRKKQNDKYIVVDIGGAANPWCKDYVDYYVDFNGTSKNIINGDIQSETVWAKVKALNPDFCICTHTLEDIRDPGWVINKINQTFSAGFISIPNKHQELSLGLESVLYPGWCHHRWVFALDGNNLQAMAKFPVTICFSGVRKWLGKLTSVFSTWSVSSKFLRKIKVLPLNTELDWIDERLAHPDYELGFLFENGFQFNYINNDYAGNSLEDLINLYQNKLSAGL